MRRVHICPKARNLKPPLLWTVTCNVSRHFDCRNSGIKGMVCQGGVHYTKVGLGAENFYSTTPLLQGDPKEPEMAKEEGGRRSAAPLRPCHKALWHPRPGSTKAPSKLSLRTLATT